MHENPFYHQTNLSLPRGELQQAQRILRSTASGSACGTMLRIFCSSKLRLINEQMTDDAQMMYRSTSVPRDFRDLSRLVSQVNFPRSRGGFLMGYSHSKSSRDIVCFATFDGQVDV
jgi:hypothetical protein